MPPKSKQPKNKQTKSANDKEYANYSMKEKYKLLEYEPNVSVKNSYENWTIRIDDKSKGININSYMNDKLIPYNIYFDPNFQSAWQNEIYNLHLPRNFTDFKSIKIEDVVNGKYLAKSDDATGAKLSVITEKKYCDAVQRLNTFKNILTLVLISPLSLKLIGNGTSSIFCTTPSAGLMIKLSPRGAILSGSRKK